MSSYLFLIPFLIYFYRWFFLDTNFYKMIGVIGMIGAGKSSYIAKKSQKYLKKGYTVYSNVPVAGTYLYNPADVGLYTFPPGSVVFCDEIGLIWHNRDYKNFKKCVIEWFKLHRHYKIRFYWFSQADDADKVIRLLTQKLFIMRKFGKISLLFPVVKKISIGTNSEGQGDIICTYKYGSIFNIQFIFLPRYYGLFDSFEAPPLDIIDSTYQDYNEITRIYSDSRKWLILQFKLFFTRLESKFFTLLKIKE